MEQVVFARPKVYTRQRACGAVVRPPVVEATRPGSIPNLGLLGCGTEDFPQRGTGVRVCVRVYRCVCVKPWQACPRTSRQLICVERAVSVGAQLSSYMIPQCSWVFEKKKVYTPRILIKKVLYAP